MDAQHGPTRSGHIKCTKSCFYNQRVKFHHEFWHKSVLEQEQQTLVCLEEHKSCYCHHIVLHCFKCMLIYCTLCIQSEWSEKSTLCLPSRLHSMLMLIILKDWWWLSWIQLSFCIYLLFTLIYGDKKSNIISCEPVLLNVCWCFDCTRSNLTKFINKYSN